MRIQFDRDKGTHALFVYPWAQCGQRARRVDRIVYVTMYRWQHKVEVCLFK